jgi:TonB-linked SusC/RagA family outer membrane protein
MRKILLLFSFFCGVSLTVGAQQKTISGTVTGAEDKQPVIGCTVQLKGTTYGTLTDINGKYVLSVPQNATTLVFSYVGMKKQEVEITDRSVIDVSLGADIKGLDEVVVTAFGISKEKKALGYAVQDVKNDVIERTGNSDLSGAMQGKLSGIDIKPSSGMPGASSQVTIRGARSFTGNNNPLYVVDGMPVSSGSDIQSGAGGDFSLQGDGVTGSDISNRAIDINPADIESINVLKGQAAAALYGTRASNGVIVITTKSGRGNAIGKPIISISNTSSFSRVSRTPDYQSTYAQGNYGSYVPNASTSWGPKISDLADDPTYGGNANDHPGKFYVPQLALAELDPWVTPRIYNNWDSYYRTGISVTNNINITQATETGNFALGLSQTSQSGIAPSTGMNRWNAKASAERKLNKRFSIGFSTNFSKTDIDKLPSGNDSPLAGVLAAPRSYNLKDYPFHIPGDPYTEIYYRSYAYYDNPYWAAQHYHFNEKTDRFFGNGYINYNAKLAENMDLKVRYQLGIDTYTTHFQDVFDYGRNGGTGMLDNYGISSSTVNSLLTANYDWRIYGDIVLSAMAGNEFNQGSYKTYSEHGENFNFGGWSHIRNANIATANESKNQDRTVGTFGSLSLGWKSVLFLNATGRNDVVSTMPTNNRTFFYPSVSSSFVISELEAVKNNKWLSFAKLRVSYAEVGQPGTYIKNYFTTPGYSGSWWTGSPIQYPIGGINSYIPNNIQYDPNLKPQNTKSYEIGTELKFFNNRLGIDYTYSRQNVVDQIFTVPLAGSSGVSQLLMNGGKVHTTGHEIVLFISPVATRNFTWEMNINFSKIDNMVDELAPGVENIFLGGYDIPQVRAGIGYKYPVIYGSSYVRDANNKIVVEDTPGALDYGMPKVGAPAVIGSVSPDFILGANNSFTFKNWSFNALVEWKNGGQMYSGSNGLLDNYGMSKRTEDRESTFIFDGVKPDGTPNDIARGGPTDPRAIQDLYSNVLYNIDEYFIRDNSFVKLREISLKYKSSNKLFNSLNFGVSVFARNILLWTALENFDPESSQGNTNMGGAFERFSMPQTTSYGFSFDITF